MFLEIIYGPCYQTYFEFGEDMNWENLSKIEKIVLLKEKKRHLAR